MKSGGTPQPMIRKYKAPLFWNYTVNPSGAVIVLIFVLLYGLIFYFRGDLDSAEAMERTGLIPFDSYSYAAKGEQGVELATSFLGILGGALNWGTLPLIYGWFQKAYGIGGLLFVLLNSLAFYASLKGVLILFKPKGMEKYWLPILILICSPFVWGWLLGPNKELLVGAAITAMAILAERKRYLLFICIAAVFALAKIQLLLAAVLFMVFRRIPHRELSALIFLSLLLPVVLTYYPGLDMEQFVGKVGDEIKSAQIMTWLEKITSYPFGFIITAPIRFLLNILGGLNPDRIIEAYKIGDQILPGVNSLIFGFLFLLLFIFNRIPDAIACYRRHHDAGFLFYIFSLILLMVPFLQPRYYWWLTPYLVYLVFFNRNNIRTAKFKRNEVVNGYP